jgi:phosphoribosylaminoimidazole carboxylase PurE protein
MPEILILIGSKNDEKFLVEGLDYLKKHGITHEVIVASVHRTPRESHAIIEKQLESKQLKVIIGGAATATGLPGIVAGYAEIPVFGVRFSKEPGPGLIEDATFNLSSMPKDVPLAYTGYNEKGFLHACALAARIAKI